MQAEPDGREECGHGVCGLVEGGVAEGQDGNGASTYGGSVRFGFEGGLEVLWREEVKFGSAGALLGYSRGSPGAAQA